MKTLSGFIFCSGLLFLVSCGGSESKKSSNLEALNQSSGFYRAKIVPLNFNGNEEAWGDAEIAIAGDSFKSQLRMSGVAANSAHPQRIHLGDKCPTRESDLNQDGFIDIAELQLAAGQSMFPLGNLESVKELNALKYPMADAEGEYLFQQNFSISEFMQRMGQATELSEEINLKTSDFFDLSGKIVVIYGTQAARTLPESVASLGNADRASSLPVGCGLLVKSSANSSEGTSSGGKYE